MTEGFDLKIRINSQCANMYQLWDEIAAMAALNFTTSTSFMVEIVVGA